MLSLSVTECKGSMNDNLQVLWLWWLLFLHNVSDVLVCRSERIGVHKSMDAPIPMLR